MSFVKPPEKHTPREIEESQFLEGMSQSIDTTIYYMEDGSVKIVPVPTPRLKRLSATFVGQACCGKVKLAATESGVVVTACPDHPPMMIVDGKLEPIKPNFEPVTIEARREIYTNQPRLKRLSDFAGVFTPRKA